MSDTIIDLESDANKLLMHWLSRELQEQPWGAKFPELWSVVAREFYDHYVKWVAGTPYRVIPPADFLTVLKAVFPAVELVVFGAQAEKRFTRIRRTYPPTQADLDREAKSKQQQIKFEAKLDG